MPEVISRIRAIVRDLPRYYTGKPCKRGHIAERFTGTKICTECAPIHQANYRKKDSAKRIQRNLSYVRQYGITIEDFESMWQAQEGLCACCGADLETVKRPSVDHDHKTGKVRGIVCHGCNIHLRAFDSPLRETYAAYVDQGGFIKET